MPCSSSPAPASIRRRKKSTIECTAVSDCPTPTVSTKMQSKPAASHKMMASRVFCATPPSDPAEAEGLIKAFGSFARSSIRVLSPSMLPLLRLLLGSMASTATLWPEEVRCLPSDSIKVLFPTPGTPVIPTRIDLPEYGRQPAMISWARAWCFGSELSTRVIALLIRVRLPPTIPSTYSSTVILLSFSLLKRSAASSFTWDGCLMPFCTLRADLSLFFVISIEI